MKTKTIILFTLIIAMITKQDYSQQNFSQKNISVNDTLLNNIQQKIGQSLSECFQTNSAESLTNLDIELSSTKSNDKNLTCYWSAYSKFYLSIFYDKTGNKSKAKKEINNGIEILQKIEFKTSEEYSLLAYLQSFSLQFNYEEAQKIVEQATDNSQKAIELDSTNLRAYFVAGSLMYYSSDKSKVAKSEKYFLKAISLKEQAFDDNKLPSWGKDEAYSMLIKIYLKRNDKILAKKYFSEAKENFPNSYSIRNLKNNFRD